MAYMVMSAGGSGSVERNMRAHLSVNVSTFMHTVINAGIGLAAHTITSLGAAANTSAVVGKNTSTESNEAIIASVSKYVSVGLTAGADVCVIVSANMAPSVTISTGTKAFINVCMRVSDDTSVIAVVSVNAKLRAGIGHTMTVSADMRVTPAVFVTA